MGIGDVIRDLGEGGGLAEEIRKQFIARPDEAKRMALYKWPNQNIRFGSRITVQPDEFAYFVRQGEVVGYLPTGEHHVDGVDLPVIGRYIDKMTGGAFVKAEIYFVSTRNFADIRFGGSLGQVTDPDTSLAVSMGIHGEFAFRVFDAGKLIANLVGTRNINSNDELTGVLRDQIVKHARATLSGNLRDHRWDLTRVTDGSYYLALEPEILDGVNKAVADFGIKVTLLEDFMAVINEDSWPTFQEITRRRANLKLAADPNWVAMTQGELVLGAAEGMRNGNGGTGELAGTIAGAGIGAGLGLGIGQQMTQGMTGGGGAPLVVVACPKCGARNAETARFCNECATPLKGTPASE